MKIELNRIMCGLDGSPLMRPPDVADQPARHWTLRDVCVQVLVNEMQGERSDGVKKFERYMLAERIYKADAQIDLTAEQIALLKERIGQGFPAALVGPAYQALESGT